MDVALAAGAPVAADADQEWSKAGAVGAVTSARPSSHVQIAPGRRCARAPALLVPLAAPAPPCPPWPDMESAAESLPAVFMVHAPRSSFPIVSAPPSPPLPPLPPVPVALPALPPFPLTLSTRTAGDSVWPLVPTAQSPLALMITVGPTPPLPPCPPAPNRPLPAPPPPLPSW
jgi:hypothetical protein